MYVAHIRYILGSSGGSWATIVYSYFQHADVSDHTMLGKVVMPANITQAGLQAMDHNCVRSYTSSSITPGGLTFLDWVEAVQEIYFTPANISRGTPFSFDSDTLFDIQTRNPGLQNTGAACPLILFISFDVLTSSRPCRFLTIA